MGYNGMQQQQQRGERDVIDVIDVIDAGARNNNNDQVNGKRSIGRLLTVKCVLFPALLPNSSK
jgi:hypothetical protein